MEVRASYVVNLSQEGTLHNARRIQGALIRPWPPSVLAIQFGNTVWPLLGRRKN